VKQTVSGGIHGFQLIRGGGAAVTEIGLLEKGRVRHSWPGATTSSNFSYFSPGLRVLEKFGRLFGAVT
jgi:hypothetical protein